jgi:hypothetical protein
MSDRITRAKVLLNDARALLEDEAREAGDENLREIAEDITPILLALEGGLEPLGSDELLKMINQ